MIYVLEVNDGGLTLGNQDGELYTSPAYAVTEGEQFYFGESARSRARLYPRRTFDRFWDLLDQQPLNREAGAARSHADLAWFHLRQFWQAKAGDGAQALLAVPKHYGTERLSLLLGIAGACDMPVTGVVESAVAANATVAGDGERLLLDAGLHRVTASRVSAGDGIELESSRELADRGLAYCYETVLQFVAEQFLRETRFDPLREAALEQMLFDRIPGWLEALVADPRTTLILPAGQREHRIEISRKQLARAFRELYAPLLDAVRAHRGPVLLSSRLLALPGLKQYLSDYANVTALAPDAVVRGALGWRDDIVSDAAAPAWVTRLPAALPEAIDAGGVAAGETPTHLLHGHHAYSFRDAPLLVAQPPRALEVGEVARGAVLRSAAEQAVLDAAGLGEGAAVLVNGEAVTGARAVQVGDIVQIAPEGDEMRVIVCHGPA